MGAEIDGRYILYPEGSGWEYCRIRDGRVVSQTAECVLGTHVASQDSLAWLAEILPPFQDEPPWMPQVEDEEQREGILRLNGYAADAPVVICRVERTA